MREAAVRRMTDQILADIAKNDKHSDVCDVCRAAFERVTDLDQSTLAHVAKNHEVKHVRKAAVLRLTDQALLAEIARSDKNMPVRRAAVARVEDHRVRQNLQEEIDREAERREVERKKAEEARKEELISKEQRADSYLESLTLGQLIQMLKQVMIEANRWGSQHGKPAYDKYPQYRQVRAIGKVLYETGGESLMLEAHRAVESSIPYPGMSSLWWDGVGSWQG